MSDKPQCWCCETTEGLRVLHHGFWIAPAEYVCEECFVSRDDGPCFDDLPALELANKGG